MWLSSKVYPKSGAVAVTSEYYGENNRPMNVKQVECNGSELTLLDCNLENSDQSICLSVDDAGIVCQGKNTDRLCLHNINLIVIFYRYFYSLCKLF